MNAVYTALHQYQVVIGVYILCCAEERMWSKSYLVELKTEYVINRREITEAHQKARYPIPLRIEIVLL